ncbi:Holliday junction resolvase RecU [Mycoplasmoides pirum]|uniref:Holliday junction resolvase RecU n=1 Tax=Mycoplasmoides pirum TaxID=2122 RepID=UPI0006962DE6|nr:Holliday junction resolvase RecU [Mycoplasmoides pirum]
MKANRGMFLETIINRTIEYYKNKNVAYFSKRFLPIKIYSFNGNRIQGWLDSKTQTDYYGIFKGKYLDFEAKQTSTNNLPLANIKNHQIIHMKNVTKFGAIVFFIIYFSKFDKFFLLLFDKFLNFIETNNKCSSISFEYLIANAIELDLIFPGVLDLQSKLDNLV